MNFTFESVLTYDSETYKVKLEEKEVGTVLKDKQQGIWVAILPNSQLREPRVFPSKESAVEHLAIKAGLI